MSGICVDRVKSIRVKVFVWSISKMLMPACDVSRPAIAISATSISIDDCFVFLTLPSVPFCLPENSSSRGDLRRRKPFIKYGNCAFQERIRNPCASRCPVASPNSAAGFIPFNATRGITSRLASAWSCSQLPSWKPVSALVVSGMFGSSTKVSSQFEKPTFVRYT